MPRKLYGSGIRPACAYCQLGVLGEDKESILCRKKGVVRGDFKCRRFKYDPIRRIPKAPPQLENYSDKDFSIEL